MSDKTDIPATQLNQMLDTARQAVNNDAIVQKNSYTGQGGFTDPSSHNVIIQGVPVPDQTCANLLNGSDIARKIASKLPQDALKQGVQVKIEDPEVADGIVMDLDDINAVPKFLEASIYARAFGGAAIIMGIDDNREPNKELNYDKIKGLYSLDVVDKRYLIPNEYDEDPMSPTFGEPLVYRLISICGKKNIDTYIHRSRMIIFEGLPCTYDERLRRNSWWLSIYDLVLPIIEDFNAAYSQTGSLMNKATQAVFKVKDLVKQLSSKNNNIVQQRWNITDAYRSIFKAIVLDSDNEDFKYESTDVKGWPDLITSYQQRLSTAADIPVAVLIGQQPNGLSTINEADLRIWNGEVVAYQNQYLKHKFEHLIKIIALAKDIELPKVWSVQFPSPYQMTPSEITAHRSAIATIDSQNITAGIFTKEEVALFRSKENGYNEDMILSHEGAKVRQELLDTKYEAAVMGSTSVSEETETDEPDQGITEETESQDNVETDSKKKSCKCKTDVKHKELFDFVNELPQSLESDTAKALLESEQIFTENLTESIDIILESGTTTPQQEEELSRAIEEERTKAREAALLLLILLYGISSPLSHDEDNVKWSKRASSGIIKEIKNIKFKNPAATIEEIKESVKWKINQVSSTENTEAFSKETDNQIDKNKENIELQGLKKYWSAIIDGRTCEECLILDGSIIGPNDRKPPLHPNCRCTIVVKPQGNSQ